MTAQGVVADLDDADRLAREDSRQPGITLGKELAEILAKQRQYPDGLADGGAQGAREDLVGKDAHGAVGRQLVDDDGPVAYLRQRQQLPVSAGHELRILAALVLRVLRAQQRNALVRDDQSGRGSAHLLDRLQQDPLQLISAVARGLVHRAVAEQQLEIPVARFDGARELLERGARQQLAAQALEHRSQECVGDGEGAGLGVGIAARTAHHDDDCHQLLAVIAQPAQIHRQPALQQAHLAWALGTSGLQRVLDEIVEIRPGRSVRRPLQAARGVVERHAGCARKHGPHELQVGLEGGRWLDGLLSLMASVSHPRGPLLIRS
ncbi:MAG: hypothetical protein E6K24_03785 [Gammaproteobacteria bacterium]|nr:MAG: hypothetical protein E6K24_03785 [Gammaproteobacteria bacterium]